jgi:serine/threonine protein kinase
MTDYFQSTPDGSWEVVSLLDQYHRLGKIESALFQRLTSQFQSVAFGAEVTGARRPPPPLTQVKAPAAPATECSPVSVVDPRIPRVTQGNLKADESLRGRYRLGRVLQRDAVGTVYEAIDQERLDLSERNRKTAIKVVHKDISARVDLYNELRLGFEDLQSLSHPNILRVHEFERDGDTVFFSMELLSGLPLSAVLSNRNHLPLERTHASTILRQVGDAIRYAHSRGVVHGDIRPHNIFVTDEGEIRVLGFGGWRLVPSDFRAAEFNSNQQPFVVSTVYPGDQALQGHVPEKGDDLYGIACLACVLWTGYHPFNNLGAAEARALRRKPQRPPGLADKKWNALRSALKFEREHAPSDIAMWLQQVVQHQGVQPLPILSVLLTSPGPQRRFSAGRTMILLLALGAAVGIWIHVRFEPMAGIVATLDTQARRVATVADSWVTLMSGAVRESTGGASAKPGVDQSTAAPLSPALEPAASAATTSALPPRPTTIDSGAQNHARTPADIAPLMPADNSPSRIELALETTEVSNDTPAALVQVRRKGNLLRDATFIWWTEVGTARSGADFESVAPRIETIKAGKDRINLQIPIVSNPTRRQTKNFFVVIDQPGPHVSLGSRTAAKVSILPTD